MSFQDIINKYCNKFTSQLQEQINRSNLINSRNHQLTFPCLGQKDIEFYDREFFEKSIEGGIREYLLVRPIAEILLACKSQINHVYIFNEPYYYLTSIEDAENRFGSEIIIERDTSRTGVRFCFPFWNIDEVKRILNKEHIDKIEIIDMSSGAIEGKGNSPFAFGKIMDYITVLSLENFMLRFISQEEFDYYYSSICKCVQDIYDYLGVNTIYDLTPQKLFKLKGDVVSRESKYDLNQEYEYVEEQEDNKQIDGSKRIGSGQRKLIKSNYENQDLSLLFGSSVDFIKSFLTSEYLYDCFRSNSRFDYTAIVAGYLKAIEQLLNSLLQIELNKKNSTAKIKVFYKYKTLFATSLINVEKANELYFDRSLAELANCLLLCDSIWIINRTSRDAIKEHIKAFRIQCRNSHFHKDNLYDFEKVTIIRNNAIYLIKSILGGYNLNLKHYYRDLGIRDFRFSMIYINVKFISSTYNLFEITIKGKRTYCINQRSKMNCSYTSDGYIDDNRICFSSISIPDSLDFYEDDTGAIYELIEMSKSKTDIIITKTNLPESLYYICEEDRTKIDMCKALPR